MLRQLISVSICHNLHKQLVYNIMPKRLTAQTSKNTFFKGRSQRKLKCHPEFTGLSHNEIAMLMTQTELDFSRSYVFNDCNATKAAFEACYDADHSRFKSERHRQQICSTKGMQLLLVPTVNSYLYNYRLYQLRKHNKNVSRNFESYLSKYEEMRDESIAGGDIPTAIKAHKEVGVLLGHTDGQSANVSKSSDSELIKSIAGSNAELSKALSKALGVREPALIEGSVVDGG